MRFRLTGDARSLRLAALCALASVVAVLAAAVTLSGTVARFDSLIVGGAVAAEVDPLTDWIRSMTALANTEVIVAVAALAVALCAGLRHWRGSLTVALSLAASQVTVALVKALLERPRPAEPAALADASGFSFPSGHAATAVAVYAVLAFIAARALRGLPRLAVATAGAFLVVAIGASRVYLGLHYPTDVIAGWLTGAAIALAAWWATEWIREQRRQPTVA